VTAAIVVLLPFHPRILFETASLRGCSSHFVSLWTERDAEVATWEAIDLAREGILDKCDFSLEQFSRVAIQLPKLVNWPTESQNMEKIS